MFGRTTIGKADTVANVVILLVSAFLMYQGYKLGPGWGDSGPDPGFFPFALALTMALGAAAALIQARIDRIERLFFEDRQEIVDLLRVGLPAAAAIAVVPVLGLYLTTVVYVGLFAWWYGGFRWYWSAASGLVCAIAMYLMLWVGFRIQMPQSLWYGKYLPF